MCKSKLSDKSMKTGKAIGDEDEPEQPVTEKEERE
jgi:hypothetical protein